MILTQNRFKMQYTNFGAVAWFIMQTNSSMRAIYKRKCNNDVHTDMHMHKLQLNCGLRWHDAHRP